MNLRFFLFFLLTLLLNNEAWAQYSTTVTIRNLKDPSLRESVENTLSNLFTEFNSASEENRTPKLKGYNMDESTKTAILNLWETSPYRCEETDVVQKASRIYADNEYEIRNIPFVFKELNPEDQYQQVAISFDKNGKLTSFHIAILPNLYDGILSGADNVKEVRKRYMILDFVEQFRTAYDTRDIKFMEQIFSDDALIITGRKVKQKPSSDNNFKSERVEYLKQNKKQYINRLKGIFARNSRIHVTFDDIKIEYHPVLDDWYGVKLKQGYTAGTYHDDGYLYLVWDFTDPDNPQIHVRVWEDENALKESKSEPFSMDDIEIRK